MNNTRNFTNDISNKTSFISLKNEINKKIKETLFDDNSLFLSSSFNYFCSNYKSLDLIEEGKNISNILDNILSTNNEEEINENCNSNSVIIGEKKGGVSHGGSESKKNLNESEDEKSSSFKSKISHIEEKKKKYKICLLNNNDLLYLLNINNNDTGNKNDENRKNFNINKNELIDLDKEKIHLKINDLKNKIKSKNLEIKNKYLRKMVCLKLFKALNFGLKNYNFKENDIRIICLYIETQARIIDNSMTSKYKEFIENIIKKISCENKNNI